MNVYVPVWICPFHVFISGYVTIFQPTLKVLAGLIYAASLIWFGFMAYQLLEDLIKHYVYTYILKIIGKHIFLITFQNKPELIFCAHS